MRNMNYENLLDFFLHKLNKTQISSQINEITKSETNDDFKGIVLELIEAIDDVDFEAVIVSMFNLVPGGGSLFEWLEATIPHAQDSTLSELTKLLELIKIILILKEHTEDTIPSGVELIFHENLAGFILENLISTGMINEDISHYFDIEKYKRECIATNYQQIIIDAPLSFGICELEYYLES